VLHTAPRHWLWHPKQADLDTALAREIAEAEEARRKAAAALAERLAKEAAERVERRAREAAERRHAEAEEAERLARELEAERLAEEARLAVEDAEAEARQEQYLRDLEVWQAESAKRREAALLAFANRVPIALAWAADYYPVRAALPPSLVFEEDDILRLFELCPSRRAHLALVDQPAIRRWFSNPRCRVAAKAAWDRYAGAP
jgi:hypothetical protein